MVFQFRILILLLINSFSDFAHFDSYLKKIICNRVTNVVTLRSIGYEDNSFILGCFFNE